MKLNYSTAQSLDASRGEIAELITEHSIPYTGLNLEFQATPIMALPAFFQLLRINTYSVYNSFLYISVLSFNPYSNLQTF